MDGVLCAGVLAYETEYIGYYKDGIMIQYFIPA